MNRALVTGATGFVGRHLVQALQRQDWVVDATSRSATSDTASDNSCALLPAASLPELDLARYDVVFHLAGMAHASARGGTEDELFRVNVDETLALYRRAVQAQVRTFIWLSSIKALADVSDTPVKPDDTPAPGDAYGRSKAAAEAALLAEPSAATALHVVRPPLVYGPGVKANFLALLKIAGSGWPLPLGGASAPRAWVSVDNLNALLLHIATAQVAGPKVWHVRDAEQTSVRDMLRQLAQLSGRRARLFTMPRGMLLAGAALLGRRDMAQRLLCPLQVDMQVTQDELGWRPPHPQHEELQKVVAWYQTR